MLWVLLATIPACFWALTNILDEFMAKEHFAKAGALLIFLSSIFELIPAAILYIFFVDGMIPLSHALIIGGLGIMLTCSFVPYIYALQLDNASNATPIFQTIPVFVFILGWLFLGDTATPIQMMAAVIIIISSILVGVDFKSRSVNQKAIFFMLLSSLMISLEIIGAKYFIDQHGWAVVTLFTILGSSLFSIVLIASYKPFRVKSVATLQNAGLFIAFIFMLQVGLHIFALTLYNKAISIAPSAALVSTVSGSQPAFVLLFSILAGLTASKHFPVIKYDRVLTFKFAMIACIMIGVYLLART